MKCFLYWCILGVGIILRSIEYISGRSLWYDEAVAATKLTYVPLYQLIQPEGSSYTTMLGYPIGFLAIQKFFIGLFGSGEWALRLFPFMCGLLSLFVFERIARKIFPGKWFLLPLFIFAISRDLIYYTSELKPYSSDVLCVLILIWIFLYIKDKAALSMKAFMGVTVVSVMSLYIAYPSLFVMVAVGSVMMLDCVRKKQMIMLRQMSCIAVVCCVSFVTYYVLSLRHFSGDERIFQFWHTSFLPWQEGPIHVVQWLVVVFRRIFQKFLQMPPGLAGVLFLVGVCSLKCSTRKILILPIVAALILSALQKYPFDGRLILYLFPLMILVIGYGIYAVATSSQLIHHKKITTIVLSVLLFFPMLFTTKQMLEPFGPEDIQPVLSYMKERIQTGDAIVFV